LGWPAISGPPSNVMTMMPCSMGVILLSVLSASPRAISYCIGHSDILEHSRNEAMTYAAFPGVELVMGGVMRLEAAMENCQIRPVRNSGNKTDSCC
jgi:hypothetical protein